MEGLPEKTVTIKPNCVASYDPHNLRFRGCVVGCCQLAVVRGTMAVGRKIRNWNKYINLPKQEGLCIYQHLSD